jgi:hypothetical protein
MTLDCPIDGCDNGRQRDHAMCPGHWRQVPHDLQAAVYRTWRARRRHATTETITAHLQALEDAEAAVEGREPEELFP